MDKDQMTEEKKSQTREDQLNSLIEFFELNNIPPGEGLALCMYLISVHLIGICSLDRVQEIFKRIWESTEKEQHE